VQSNSRLEILERIAVAQKRRLAFVEKNTNVTDEIYKSILPDAVSCFKNELEEINGQCVLCEDESDLYSKLKSFVDHHSSFQTIFCRDNYIANQLKINHIQYTNAENDFEKMDAGITSCEFLVARTGSVIVSSASLSGRQMNVFPPVHIVLAHVSQLVSYPEDALIAMQEKYGDALPSTITFISGPSRTADIEKTLVLGAHGPKEFIVFLSKM
jgi:L-lactate dehydrogenase complex protein LldG